MRNLRRGGGAFYSRASPRCPPRRPQGRNFFFALLNSEFTPLRGKRCFSHVLAHGLSIPTMQKMKKSHVGYIFRHLIMASGLWSPVVRGGLFASGDLRNYADSNGTRWVDHFCHTVCRKIIMAVKPEKEKISLSSLLTIGGGRLFPEVHLGGPPRRPRPPLRLSKRLYIIHT